MLVRTVSLEWDDNLLVAWGAAAGAALVPVALAEAKDPFIGVPGSDSEVDRHVAVGRARAWRWLIKVGTGLG